MTPPPVEMRVQKMRQRMKESVAFDQEGWQPQPVKRSIPEIEVIRTFLSSTFQQSGLTLRECLQRCTDRLVTTFDAAFLRIWTFNESEDLLELQASSGMYRHIDGEHSRIPLGKLKIGMIALERGPHISNDVANDPRISDREW